MRISDWSSDVCSSDLSNVALLGVSIPNYVIAPLLILLFAMGLGWLPAGGWRHGAYADMVLPVIALALPQVAYIARLLRGSLIETMAAPYIRTARARGLSERLLIRSEEHTSELQSLMRISNAVFCLNKQRLS